MTKLASVLLRSAALAGMSVIIAQPVAAQAQEQTYQFELPAQDLASSLRNYARVTRHQITFRRAEVAGINAPAVQGRMTAARALDRLLAGSGLFAQRGRSGVIIIRRLSEASARVGGATASALAETDIGNPDELVITGSRIRGAPPAAPVIEITAEDMRVAGQTDLGQAIRSLPQNFSGGQNPGIGRGAETLGSANETSASSANLRGLGPGATLTLINGRRLAYTGLAQGVDISSIPFAAVDRIEIIADGASAQYGSDAVGGVVNVILRESFEGFAGTGRIAAATDGGYTRYQLNSVGGVNWSDGGILVAGDLSRSNEIEAGQRPYTSGLFPETDIYPRLNAVGGLVSARQALGNMRLGIEGLFNQRRSRFAYSSTTTAPFNFAGSAVRAQTSAFQVAPRADVVLPGRWRATVAALYGFDRLESLSQAYNGGALTFQNEVDLRNSIYSIELGAEGPLLTLPSGDTRFAFGGGFRRITQSLQSILLAGPSPLQQRSRETTFAYAELFIPLASPAQNIRGLTRLSASASLRYEDYDTLEAVVTPKVGLRYSPIPDLTFSATWGRSFKAPTLGEQFGTQASTLLPPAFLGGSGFPTGSTVLFLAGSNDQIAPERAESWTATLSVDPRAVPGLRFDGSVFQIRYEDRIASQIPGTAITQSLSNPLYRPFVLFNPSAVQVQAAVDCCTFQNFVGQPLNPATVVAIVDSRLANIAEQRVSGLDISGSYRFELGSSASLTLTAGAAYLKIRRRITEGSPRETVSGTIFQPPSWRGRAGAVFRVDRATFGAHANFIDSLDDRRSSQVRGIDATTTIDLFASYRLRSPISRQDVEISLSAVNLFNERPQTIATSSPSLTPFDSANYDAIGRLLTLSLSALF